MMTAMAGYGRGVFTFRNGYFVGVFRHRASTEQWLTLLRTQFWCAILAPICGALFGSFLYDAFI